jgi:uncharacterized protein with GYD domain
MAHYLLQVSYTPEAWAAMLKNPQDRSQAVEGAIQALGGTTEQFWLSFGEYDVVGIFQLPDSVSAAAFAMAISAGGSCKSCKTTPLLTVQEGMEAMKKASVSPYQPLARKAGA